MGVQGKSHSISLVSRLDCFNSIMNYTEGKLHSLGESSQSTSEGGVEREGVPLDLAVQNVKSKGSLLDRIEFLEDRLVQLRLEIESCLTASSRHGSKSELVSSYPTFNFPNPRSKRQPQIRIDAVERQKKYYKLQRKAEHPNHLKQQLENSKDGKPCRGGKKAKHLNWLHMKILGC